MTHELRLTSDTKGTLARNVWKEVIIKVVGEKDSRVYRTFCGTDVNNYAYVLLTTSKDLHLLVGTFSEKGRNQLCLLFEQEFERAAVHSFLLSFQRYDEAARNVMLVTRTRERKLNSSAESDYIYHISPAH
jgi:hypothetical protein